ncbi:MAG: DUF3160 domain-containing protein [Candidatus Riflebacteria bacterium]|nr:DUF3160 domain-containing protein [Candidatus Riflebacteria bacterium]
MNRVSSWGMALVLTMAAMMAVMPGRGAAADRAGGSFGPRVLPAVTLGTFGPVPAARRAAIVPRMADTATTVDKAGNGKAVLEWLGITLNGAQESFLNTHKFLIVPKRATRFKGQVSLGAEPLPWDEMLGMYDETCGSYQAFERLPHNAHLVTPDIVLHAFHKYLGNALEHLEATELAPTVRRLCHDLRTQALAASAKTPGRAAARLQMLAAQFTVPCVLLDTVTAPFEGEPAYGDDGAPLAPPDEGDTAAAAAARLAKFTDLPPELARLAAAELELIYKAEGMSPSPLFGAYTGEPVQATDYSQFKPRSHYAKSSALRAYFRAMIYLGRHAWTFHTDTGVRDAVLLAWLLAGPGPDGTPLLDAWQRVMRVTGFFAGMPDDISYPEWRNLLADLLGKQALTPDLAMQPAFVAKVVARLGTLAPPRILSDVVVFDPARECSKDELLARTKGFRFFGQRFSFDAWVLGRLTGGDESSKVKLPSTPSAVFLSAAFGDPTAREQAQEYLKGYEPPFANEEIKAFLGRLDEVAADLGRITEADWFGSLAAGWLRVLGTLTGTWGAGYPLYMTSPLFGRRQIESFLGSFAELKHDMLLYVKQNYAEYGDGGDEGKMPPVVKGFVEPNLRFWNELRRLVGFFQAGLQKNGILPQEAEEYSRLNRLVKAIDLFASLAEKELQGKPISEKEYEELRLLRLSEFAMPFIEGPRLEDDQLRSALIADVHTDGVKQTVLYEATGEPAFMLVLVGNEKSPRLAVGPVFNHYEFSEPMGTRLSDEDWRKRVYEDPVKIPAKPAWSRPLSDLK